MKLFDITLQNFGPYHGEHAVSFGKDYPIVIIHGENMRGKTSFLNSIRWVLYGKALNRFNQRMNLLQLINFDAAEQNDWTMSVNLNFSVDDTLFSLTRAVQLKKLSMVPTKDSDFEVKLFLKKNHNHLSPNEAQTEVNRVLPESISRFFLFDGELLNEYELLLSQVEKQSTLIKGSIEQILGVPAVTNSIIDLKLNLRDASNRQQNLAKRDKSAKGYAKKASELTDSIDILEFDVQEVKKQANELLIKQKTLNEELQQTAGIEADAKRLFEFEQQISFLKEEEKRLSEEKRIKLAEAWKDLLQPKIQTRIEELEKEREKQYSYIKNVENIRSKIRDINSILAQRVCPTCGQQTQVNTFELEKSKAKLQSKLLEQNYDEEKFTQANQSIKVLRLVKPTNVGAAIKLIEDRLTEIRVNIVDVEGKIEDLNDRLKSYDYSSVIRNRLEYERVTKAIGSLELVIEKSEKLIESKKAEATTLRTKIINVSGPEMEKANREVQLYEDLISLFNNTLNKLRNELRLVIEQDASSIFLQLTTDKSYTGLQINDFYGLTILDSNGSMVPVRSAGAEQVVALSLIGALNQNAIRQGPIIMDTPFGRLDPKHRENILKFIPTFANQVTLLVHGGELNRQKDLNFIKENIERQYEIRYISSRRSEIVPCEEN